MLFFVPPASPTTSPTLGSIGNPAASCGDIPSTMDGDYYLINSTNATVEVYCDMECTECECDTNAWMRVAGENYNVDNAVCPEGFEFRRRGGVGLCRRSMGDASCSSMFFPTHGVEYSHVCGRVIGVQWGTPSAFHSSKGINGPYLDGVSLTHDDSLSTRKHIWSFAAATTDQENGKHGCPCTSGSSETLPSFVPDNNYFCESGHNRAPTNLNVFATSDFLWNGRGCADRSQACCNKGTTFCRQLDQPTTSDIELRVCCNEDRSTEDILIREVDLYVQ